MYPTIECLKSSDKTLNPQTQRTLQDEGKHGDVYESSKYRIAGCICLIEVNTLMAVGGEIWTAVTSEDEYTGALFLCRCQGCFVFHSQFTALSSSTLVWDNSIQQV